MRVAMIGVGYVGLVSGTCFADFGHDVVCIDKNAERIEKLHQGIMPIYEPGLDVLVANNVKAGRLSFTTELAKPVAEADVVFIAVGTPSRRGDGYADLTYVYAAAEEIAKHLRDFTVVVTKSTVPVGTGDEVEAIIRKVNPEADVEVVSNPEFLREGAAIEDFKRPDRVVVGVSSERAEEMMRELYRPLYLNETPLVVTDRRTSELIKYAANAFLATKIGFINQMADLCEAVGADVQQVSRGIGLDKRIGPKFLHASPGYGGSCFPKDTLALSRTAADAGHPVTIVDAVISSNDERKAAMAERIRQAAGGSLEGKTVAVLGLAFKPNTDDMRDAPSLVIVPAMQKMGASVRAFDPEAMEEAKAHFDGVFYASDTYDALSGADLAVILTEWNLFRALDLERVAALLGDKTLIDLRNIYRPSEVRSNGLTYHSIGRP
ncbi:UDP-glucose dehydrogenase family protein [Notoacmeibacter ruber]|uniref:UDP-glucose 6-dehydrogenase n=1 Tax=Notoacmeibacter ruber TaxID=2670375 RepID=A0A3L7JAU3_9HYPH|nr:UDP-glucose/GDP-mannose dehydrogenase family protein [Notoacmeibacter ruber]RLQ87564.1 UDP-glucose/GDP-mannose dehydrogenase family protein [Notoacmeibacter ruber]